MGPPARTVKRTVKRDLKGGGFRPDVQGLRALAVTMVVAYHLSPSLVPGGFAGVDVFFVISGFLITGHLWREYRETGRVRLVAFWGRRAKRLIPAAAFVLAVTWVASLRLLPAAQLPDTAAQVRASALYFQNWQLADDAVDYLKSANAASPVQHFWSLSVEEQFYLVWPLLFLAGTLAACLARRARRRERPAGERAPRVPGALIIGCLTAALALASLAYSGYETRANPAAAYFITTTRIWELGIGGLIALLPARLARAVGRHGWLAWAGLGMAVASAFTLRGTIAFPGFVALLPVGGSALLIACGSAEGRFGPARLMSLRPLVFIGGISYALYLWHWPIIALWTSGLGHRIGVVAGLVIAAVSVLLAWLTKVWVEDRIRQARLLTDRDWRSVSVALAAALPVALVFGFLVTRPPPWNGRLGPGHPGAAVLADAAHAGAKAPSSAPTRQVLPPLTQAPATMEPLYWQQGCLDDETSAVPKECVYGDAVSPRLTVVLVGDSIAGNWFPALNKLATQQHWELVTELHGLCSWSAALQWDQRTSSPYTACQQWGASVLHDLLSTIHPDLVITSSREIGVTADHRAYGPAAQAEIGAGMAAYWEQLQRAGVPVVAIRETPELHGDVASCVASHPANITPCGESSARAIVSDPPSAYAERDLAAAGLGGTVPVVNMNSLICGPRQCQPVVGNVLVYFDYHHMTGAYGQTLAPFLLPRLEEASAAVRTAAGLPARTQVPGGRGGDVTEWAYAY